MSEHLIQKIVIDPAVRETLLARRILARKGEIPVEFKTWTNTDCEDIPLHHGKKILYVTEQAGGLVKPCPATNPPYLCCRYTTIHAMNQCTFDCTYCVLQGYLERPVITVFANEETIFREIDEMQRAEPHRFFRFGTGELADSLALDDLTGLSGDYLRFFHDKRNAIIELKTKSVQVQNLLGFSPRNAVISWSVNPQEVIDREELRAPSLSDRLDAARRCMDAGYLIGFHPPRPRMGSPIPGRHPPNICTDRSRTHRVDQPG
jgi:spore photoproduct lyase